MFLPLSHGGYQVLTEKRRKKKTNKPGKHVSEIEDGFIYQSDNEYFHIIEADERKEAFTSYAVIWPEMSRFGWAPEVLISVIGKNQAVFPFTGVVVRVEEQDTHGEFQLQHLRK